MCIVICVLKLVELVWTISIARVHIDGFEAITNGECISQIIFSILILVPIVVLICKKMKSAKEYIITSVSLIIYTAIWVFLMFSTIKFNYPLNLKAARFIGLLSSIIIMMFSITKGYEMLSKDDIDINEKTVEKQ